MVALHLFIGLLALQLILVGLTRLLRHYPYHGRFQVVTAALEVVLWPALIFLGGTLLRDVAEWAGYSKADTTLYAFVLLLVHLFAAGAMGRLLKRYIKHSPNVRLQRRMSKLSVGLIYIGLMMAALSLFLWRQGYTFTGVWVSTGVAAAVIGFAMQRTLGDFLAGIALNIERPFRIGEWLELSDGVIGQVVDINWRATHLRRWDQSTQVVPNSRMAGDSFKNLHGEQHPHAPWYFVQIPADVNPRFATALLLDAAMRCKHVLKYPSPTVRLADATSQPFRYLVWVHMKNYPSMFQAREELFREIHLRLKEAGVAVAPSVHELHTRRAHVTEGEPPTLKLALKSLDIAALFSAADLDQLAAQSEFQLYNPGDTLLAEGAVSDTLYAIAGGIVDGSITLHDGTQKLVTTLGPGQSFGISEMMTTEPSFLEFTAKTDVTLIRIDLDCVRDLAERRPEFVERLAVIIKERLDAAQSIRDASRQETRRFSLRDIRLSIEQRMRGQ